MGLVGSAGRVMLVRPFLRSCRWGRLTVDPNGSRDRTRTYNLPVNRRPVMAGSARGCK